MDSLEKISEEKKLMCIEKNHAYYMVKRGEVEVIAKGMFIPIYCSNCMSFIYFDIPTDKEVEKYNNKSIEQNNN